MSKAVASIWVSILGASLCASARSVLVSCAKSRSSQVLLNSAEDGRRDEPETGRRDEPDHADLFFAEVIPLREPPDCTLRFEPAVFGRCFAKVAVLGRRFAVCGLERACAVVGRALAV